MTNRIHYTCDVNAALIDTTKEYYDEMNGNNCDTLDLREKTDTQTLYFYPSNDMHFDNEIKVKNLGVGWDRATIYISGGMLNQSEFGKYFVRINQQGITTIVITTCDIKSNCKQKSFLFRKKKLPLPKK